MSIAARAFHLVTDRSYVVPTDEERLDWDYSDDSVPRWIERFDGHLRFEGRTALDIGCGSGGLCVEAARRGATEVLGVDAQILFSRDYLRERGQDVADRVDFLETDGTLDALAGRTFDIVMSKDAFEHYGDPEAMFDAMESLVAPGGSLVIGFGALWKSPIGGHIDFMTKLPWAHLIFPEPVIMRERRRFRPDEDASTFGEIRGGLNKMTYARFCEILERSRFERVYHATNVSDNPVVRAMDVICRIPPLREYFMHSIYTILRKPDPAVAGATYSAASSHQ